MIWSSRFFDCLPFSGFCFCHRWQFSFQSNNGLCSRKPSNERIDHYLWYCWGRGFAKCLQDKSQSSDTLSWGIQILLGCWNRQWPYQCQTCIGVGPTKAITCVKLKLKSTDSLTTKFFFDLSATLHMELTVSWATWDLTLHSSIQTVQSQTLAAAEHNPMSLRRVEY